MVSSSQPSAQRRIGELPMNTYTRLGTPVRCIKLRRLPHVGIDERSTQERRAKSHLRPTDLIQHLNDLGPPFFTSTRHTDIAPVDPEGIHSMQEIEFFTELWISDGRRLQSITQRFIEELDRANPRPHRVFMQIPVVNDLLCLHGVHCRTLPHCKRDRQRPPDHVLTRSIVDGRSWTGISEWLRILLVVFSRIEPDSTRCVYEMRDHRSYQIGSYSDLDCLSPGSDRELLEDMCQMRGHGALADEELPRDLRIRSARRDQRQHFALPDGETYSLPRPSPLALGNLAQQCIDADES